MNNAFYRILAPPVMTSFCQGCSLNCSFRKVWRFQTICCIYPMCHRNFRSWLRFFFLGSLFLSRRWWKAVSRSAGFSADALLMGRHRPPAMSWDSICFGVHVDGICAVELQPLEGWCCIGGCEGELGRAGLQCSEVGLTSKQVFTSLQLDHKTGVLSLEASRIWRLRRGLEYAARQSHLTGD